MEMIIKQANDMILRQKDEIEKAKDNQAVKEQVKKMEQAHAKEKKDSQAEFEKYKAQMAQKEANLEREYKERTQEMKLDL